MARFERALEVAESMANHRVLLTTTELIRLNNILTGKDPDSDADPWRKEPVTITLPSGNTETLALIADPKVTAREKLHKATEMAESGASVESAVDAAVEIYTDLVLAYVFADANRRTAVLAAHYFLARYGSTLSGIALHEIGLGDLREPGQKESLRETVRQMILFAARKGRKK